MVKIFRQNVLLQFILIMVVGVLLWLPALLEGGVAMPNQGVAPLYELFYTWLSPHPMVATIIGLLLVLIEGWVLNLLLYNNKLIPQNTLLPMLCYVCLMSQGSVGLTLTPMVLVNLILLICAGQLMVPENLTITYDQLFSSAALIGLASLFYLPAIVLVLPLMITFMVHSLYRWRHWVMLLLGLLAPYIVVATVYFLTDHMRYASYLAQCMLGDYALEVSEEWSVVGFISQVFLMGLLVVSLGSIISTAREHNTMYRENITTLCLPLMGGVLMLGYSGLFPLDWQLMAVPAATLVSCFFLTRAPRKRMGTVVVDITLILFILLCY